MSDTPDLPEEPADKGASAAHPEVPDLLPGADASARTGATGSAAAGAEADSANAAPPPPSSPGGSKDSQRLMIAIGILVLVAVAAIGVGIARKGSSDTASTTPTTATTAPTSTTAATAANGKTPTTKAGSDGTTKPAAGCKNGNWPASYTAGGDAAVLKQPGVHVWNQNPGWKLRIIDADGKVYSGEIVGNFALEPTSFKTTGAAKVEAKDNKATFEITGSKDAAGIDFQMPCAVDQFTIKLTTPGPIAVSPDVITIGKDAKAIGNPITVTRRPGT